MLGGRWGWSRGHVLGRGGKLELQRPRGSSPTCHLPHVAGGFWWGVWAGDQPRVVEHEWRGRTDPFLYAVPWGAPS